MFVNRSELNIENLPMMLATMFQFNSPCGFRGDNFLEINSSETRIACGGHVFNAWEINEQSL
jgi:hypothetical protein